MTLKRLGGIMATGLACLAAGCASHADSPDGQGAALVQGKLVPRTGLPVGWDAPNVELWTPTDMKTNLETLVADAEGPLVLVFYRGGWCPYCVKHLAELEEYRDRLEAEGAMLVAVSPESPEKIRVTQEKTGADYAILSDKTMDAASRFNLLFQVDDDTQTKYRGYGIDLDSWNATGEWALPVPAVFVIDKDMTVRWAHADEDYRTRVAGRDVLEAVKKVNAGG